VCDVCVVDGCAWKCHYQHESEVVRQKTVSYISSDINWWFIRDNYLTYNCNDHFMSYNWLFFIVLCVD